MTQEGLYRIEPIQENDTDDVMKLLKRTFFLDEPMNKTVGLCSSETDPCPELEGYCTKSLNEGLSYKAIDSKDNIVGVLINGVCPLKEDDNGNDLLSMAKKCKNPKFQKILYILAQRETGARLWERFPHEKSLVEVKVAATDPTWRRKGIMEALLKVTEYSLDSSWIPLSEPKFETNGTNLKAYPIEQRKKNPNQFINDRVLRKATLQRNIKLMRMDTSSAYSAMSAERLGYTCVYNALYRDIKLDGRPLIVPDPPHEEDSVYVKMLFNPDTVDVQ